MAERRPLIQGIKPEPLRATEDEFVYGGKAKPAETTELAAIRKVNPVSRAPFTTRIRADLANAVKRASLERRLAGVEPQHVQEILENALEHWLRANGYLTER